jgi:hypothetical protein
VLFIAALAFLPLVYALTPNLSFTAKAFIAVAVFVFAGLSEYLHNVKPAVDFDAKKTFMLHMVCDGAFQELKKRDTTARLNIMEAHWWIRQRIGSINLPRLGRFEQIFGLEMEGHPDAGLGLWLNQGACGESLAKKELCIAELDREDCPLYGMSEDQREKTKGLTLVCSLPIRGMKRQRDGKFVYTDDIIGVINIDSRMMGAYKQYQDGHFLGDNEHQTMLHQLSGACSYILS